MRTPFRVRALTTMPGTREGAERNDLANSGAAAATANKEKSVGEAWTLLCKLTDLELSGAPRLLPGAAGRCR
jgi:hypothetical protein